MIRIFPDKGIEMTAISIFQVDAFTDRPFGGNPAGVCMLSEEKPELWMQFIAREMNLPETAFLLKRNDYYDLRWFTPKVEVELCGHATLASAHVLYEFGYLDPDKQARFQTKSGLLTAEKDRLTVMLNFPAQPEQPAAVPSGLKEALNIEPKYTGKNRFAYLLELDSELTIRNLQPNFNLLKQIEGRGIIVTARSDKKEYDFVSRFFAPAIGIDEDPVTGSAHCCLGPYWYQKLKKEALTGYQASERGGIVRIGIEGDRIRLGGKAVTIFKGEVTV